MSEQDGGPAFPIIGAPGAKEDYPGMSLRDYFAGQALASFAGDSRGVLVAVRNERAMGHNTDMIEREASTCADAAYAIADAMLAARAKGQP